MGSIDFDRVRQEYPIGKAVKTMEDGRRYLLDRLRSMEVKKTPDTVELSEEAVSEICNHYCKHPLICTSDEELQDICERCPLT